MISIIIPVYRVEKYLSQCLDSVIKQTYRNIEILLIDDGSPDKCGEICDRYARKDNRIRVFHTENNGVSAARNLGLQEAHGEYIGFVDPDDWIEPDMYEILLQRLEETGADISECEDCREYMDGSYPEKTMQNVIFEGTEIIRAFALQKIHNYVTTKLYKRECWTDIRYPLACYYEDVSALYKLLAKIQIIACTPKVLYHYRMRANSTIHNYSMKRLVDNWNVYYDRYLFLLTFPIIKNDQECVYKLEAKLASLAVQTWLWAYSTPKEKCDYKFLNEISGFVRSHFPLFGYSNWDLSFRICLFFSRHANDISLAFPFFLKKTHGLVKAKRNITYP